MSVARSVADVRRIAVGPVRRLFVGQFLKELGAGLTLALLMVYLTQVRAIPVATASMLLAWQAVLALACAPLAGTLVDRHGPRPVLLCGAGLTTLGIAGYAFVGNVWQAFVAMSLVAIAGAAIWGPLGALTARLVAPADRPVAFGFAFMLTNLGLGLGGLIAATIVDVQRPASFQVLYGLTSLAYLALLVAVLAMGPVGGRPTAQEGGGATAEDEALGSGSWGEVLRDRRLLRYGAVGLLLLTFGYGSVDAGVGLFVTETAGLPVRAVSVAFAANTAVIVLGQLVVLGLVRRRRRSRSLAAVGVVWAMCWLILATAAGMPSPTLALAACVLALAVFAFGETLWSPVAPALLNDLAPEHLRGRYNSFQSLLWGVSGALGPLVVGLLLGRSMGVAWTLLLAVGCLAAALLALSLGRFLTPEQEGLGPSPDPDRDPDPEPSGASGSLALP